MKTIRLWSLILISGLLVAGCHGSTADERENRRVLDEILTAITVKNPRLLEKAGKRAAVRHHAGQFTDEEYQGLEAIIDKGHHGDWAAAANDGYAFRKQHPFVNEGQ